MGFTLFDRKKELVIFTFICFVPNGYGASIVYTALGVNNRVKKNYQVKNSVQWLYRSCLIIYGVNIIDLLLLISIDTQLQKARRSQQQSLVDYF